MRRYALLEVAAFKDDADLQADPEPEDSASDKDIEYLLNDPAFVAMVNRTRKEMVKDPRRAGAGSSVGFEAGGLVAAVAKGLVARRAAATEGGTRTAPSLATTRRHDDQVSRDQ